MAPAGVAVVQLVVVGIAGTSALAEVGREATSAATAAAAAGEAGQEVLTRVSRGAGGRSVATGRGAGLSAFPLPAAVSRRRRGGGFLKLPVRTLSTSPNLALFETKRITVHVKQAQTYQHMVLCVCLSVICRGCWIVGLGIEN